MHFGSRIYRYENAFIDDLAKLVSIPSGAYNSNRENIAFGEQVGQGIELDIKTSRGNGF